MKAGFFLAIFLCAILITGCSKGNDPITPVNQNDLKIQITGNLPIMVDSLSDSGNASAGSGVMGVFNASINPETLTGELVSLRGASFDDALEMVDITNFLSLAPCSDCAKLMSVELDSDGHILAKIGIKHPFPAGDPLKPITGQNRGDLHVFNVEGTVVFDDSNGTVTYAGLGKTIAPAYLMNADGYSPYLDTALDELYPTLANVHPYVLHFDDYTAGNFDSSNPMGFTSVTDPPPSGNLVMAMGCDYDIQDYVFNVPDDTAFDFIFAVGCTYAVSSESKAQRFSPEFQIPQHNKKAASTVEIEIADNSLSPGNTSSSAELLIKVLDINHGVAVGEGLDEMKSDSSVGSIYVEVAGVTSGLAGGAATPTGGDGRDPLNPLTFSLTFNNDLGAEQEIYTGLVKVLDAYAPGLNEMALLDGMDAIKRVGPVENPLTGLYALDEFATYMAFEIEIEGGNPIASFVTDPVGTPDLELSFLDIVEFTSTSTDPDDPLTPEGQIVSYEWDFVWDGDPLTFTDDTAGLGNGVETHQFTTAGIYHVGLRVADGGTPPLISEIFSIQVTVDEWSEDFVIDSNNGRVPKIGDMPGGKLITVWAGANNQSHFSTFETDWASPDILSTSTSTYMSLATGPGDDEAFVACGTRKYHYDGTPGTWGVGVNDIGWTRMLHIYSDDIGGYGIFHNSSSAFGHIVRRHYSCFSCNYQFDQYIWWGGYNCRVLGESRIIDKNSSGRMFLVYMRDLALDPYRPPQDYRYVIVASMDQSTIGYNAYVIDQGANDTLDSIVIASDTSDNLHVAYLSQPNGGGDFSIIYKSSTNNGTSWSGGTIIWTGSDEPEAEYISIDTDSNNNIIVTYHVGDSIYWASSADGSSWSTTEIVNESFPGGITSDKEQYMVVDSRDWTHVVWDRCAAGPIGHGPIMHRVRAPID